MKNVVLVLACLLAATPAFADDPSTSPTTTAAASTITDDDPGSPGENLPTPPDSPAPAAPKARMTAPIPHAPLHHRARAEEDSGRLEKVENTVAGGTHWRIKTPEGAVHVWIPPGYDRATAGTVVYVHGYYVDVDTAWREYNLARQFRASRQNALFIVPEAPSGNDEAVNWPALKDLRRAVARANIRLPDGPVIVMGHSGAFRTIVQWVDHRLIEQIILLDAMYVGEKAFDEYIGSGKRADQHKLIVVGASTAQESASFAKKYKFAATREKMPSSLSGFTHHQRSARLLYIRSQYEHMAIVTSGKVIPTLLHLTPLKAL